MRIATNYELHRDRLTTHSLTIGMTGSGKTGLQVLMVEELTLQGIPVLILDLKGDLVRLNLNPDHSPVYLPDQVYVPDSVDENPPPPSEFFGHASALGTCSVIYLAHLSLAEQDRFISKVLAEFYSWMKQQGGSSSLKGCVLIDEIYGLIPPNRTSQTKPILMTLIKQARGFGYGFMLATQNPGDLDYKALSNIGTWFVGRLSTSRDRSKVIEGLGNHIDEHQIQNLSRREFIAVSAVDKTCSFKTRDTDTDLDGPIPLTTAVKLVGKFSTYHRVAGTELTSYVGETREAFEQRVRPKFDEWNTNQVVSLRDLTEAKLKKLDSKRTKLLISIHTEEDRLKARTTSTIASTVVGIASMFFSSNPLSKISKVGSVAKNAERAKSSRGKIDSLRDALAEVDLEIRNLHSETDKAVNGILAGKMQVTTHTLWHHLTKETK